jgi:hypothetical protein
MRVEAAAQPPPLDLGGEAVLLLKHIRDAQAAVHRAQT